MSALWLIAAFVAGWLACWYTSRFLLRRFFNSRSLSVDVIAGLKQDTLLKTRDLLNAEIEKRRA